MKYRELGKTGIQVSEIGFGAWGIGGAVKESRAYGPTDDKISQTALEKAFEKGVTFYDTSPLYGYGHSEELIGSTLKNVRQQIIIASKSGYVNFEAEQDFSSQHIRSSLEGSLLRLQTDYVDIFQLHDPPLSLLEEDYQIIDTLELLMQEGKIRILGVTTKSPAESLAIIEKYDFQSVQVNFSLVDQRALENGLFRKCKEKGVGIIARTPLCFGFLTGKYTSKNDYDDSDHRSSWPKEQINCWADAYKLFESELSEENQLTNAQLALRFCLSYPELSTTIPGMLTEEHVEENVSSSDFGPFAPSMLENFNRIYGGNEFFIKRR